MSVWDEFLTERDRSVYGASGYGRRGGFGNRPVILIVDMNYNFVGDRPEPIEESIKRWRNSVGAEGWAAAERIRSLLAAARGKRLPIIYTTGDDPRPDRWGSGRWGDKNARRATDDLTARAWGNTIIDPIAPMPQDVVIRKNKPSAFFGTLLAAYLVDLQADSLVICGAVTSGCVRATAVDGFSYNYRIAVIEDCTVDRGQASHALNLFDLDQKYADIVDSSEAISFIEGLDAGLFDGQKPIPVEAR